MKFGYINNNDFETIEKQKKILLNKGLLEKYIFIDSHIKKKMDFPYLETLLLMLRKDDVLIVFKLNYFGKNEIENEKTKKYICNEIGVILEVLE